MEIISTFLTPEKEAPFKDRRAAGRALGKALAQKGEEYSATLGLVRGGVPVAYEVASVLGAPLDAVAVKKLRSPVSPELAIGAICADAAMVLRDEIILELGVSEEYVAKEIQVRLEEVRAAEKRCLRGFPPLDLKGARVVIVDDGIATGATMEAAVASVRQRGAEHITVAAPVGSPRACDALGRLADDVFFLIIPAEFWAVGFYYAEFDQVSDDQVRTLLNEFRMAPETKRSHL